MIIVINLKIAVPIQYHKITSTYSKLRFVYILEPTKASVLQGKKEVFVGLCFLLQLKSGEKEPHLTCVIHNSPCFISIHN